MRGGKSDPVVAAENVCAGSRQEARNSVFDIYHICKLVIEIDRHITHFIWLGHVVDTTAGLGDQEITPLRNEAVHIGITCILYYCPANEEYRINCHSSPALFHLSKKTGYFVVDNNRSSPCQSCSCGASHHARDVVVSFVLMYHS